MLLLYIGNLRPSFHRPGSDEHTQCVVAPTRKVEPLVSTLDVTMLTELTFDALTYSHLVADMELMEMVRHLLLESESNYHKNQSGVLCTCEF